MSLPATKEDVQKEINNLESRMDSKFATKSELIATKSELKKEIRSSIRQSENRIIKKLDIIINFFDKEHLSLEKRVTKIETHLNLPAVT